MERSFHGTDGDEAIWYEVQVRTAVPVLVAVPDCFVALLTMELLAMTGGLQLFEALEALREAPGVAALGLGQGLEPVGDLGEALLARGLGHSRVHLRVLVGLAFDR